MNELISKKTKILDYSVRSWDIRIAIMTGHLNAALLYGQINHHYKNMGPFSKSNENLASEIGLSLWEFKNMKKLLIDKDFISIHHESKNRTVYSVVKKLEYCDKSYRKYDINYYNISKNINSCILLGQLIYLSEYFITDNKNDFFKTNECLMKELFLTEWELKKAKQILIKNDFIKVGIGQSGRSHYQINNERIQSRIDEVGQNSPAQLVGNQPLSRLESSCAVGWNPPAQSVGILPHNIQRDIYNNILSSAHDSKETKSVEFEAIIEERKKLKIKKEEQPMSTPNQPINLEKEETMEENKQVYQMIGIWKSTVRNDEQINLSSRLTHDLQEALQMRFQDSVDGWKAYCDKISQNEWLMGRNDTGWKAQLIWAVKLENIDKVLSGLIYGKKKPIDYKTDQRPIQLDKQELINEVFASQESYDIKKLKVMLIDFMHNAAKHIGLSSYHTYLHRHPFEESEVNGKKILTIRSSYGAFNSLLSYHHLMVKTFSSFDEVVIHGGTNDRLGNNLYMERKHKTVSEPFDLWDRLCIEKGIESFMAISQVALVNSCKQPQFL